MIISENNLTVFNDVRIDGTAFAPAVRVTGSNVRFVNTENGRVIAGSDGQSAIVLEGPGAVVINEAGGTIRNFAAFDSVNSAPVILGSAFADRVETDGTMIGLVSLGGGDDVFIDRRPGPGFDLRVDGGAGDDRYEIAGPVTAFAVRSARFSGGEGTDRLVLGAGTYNASSFSLDSVEIVELRNNGFVEGLQGVSLITLDYSDPDKFFNGLRFIDSPLADVVMIGTRFDSFANLSIYDRSSVRSVTGTANRESLFVANDSVISGAIRLGAGDDSATIGRSQFAAPVQTRIGSELDGGEGFDFLSIQLNGGGLLQADGIKGFEQVNVFDPGNTVVLQGYSGTAELTAAQRTTLVLDGGAVTGPGLVRLEARAALLIGAGTSVAAVRTLNPEGSGEFADESQSVSVENRGTVVGTVLFQGGDDLYDGRSGSAGGIIDGKAGNDTILGGAGAEIIIGGRGADLLDGGGGYDTVSFLGASGAVRVDLGLQTASGQGADTLAGFEAAIGSGFDDVLIGSGGVANELAGGGGSDVYQVQDAGDVVFEAPNAAGGVRDFVFSSASYQLLGGQGVEVLSTSSFEGTAAINLTGNEFAQELYGNAGDNVLNGLGGADTMIGFGGSDIYFVDQVADIVYEAAGAAGGVRDIVFASLSYQLAGGQAIEVLSTSSLATTTAINLTGNAFAQELYGNAGNNVLNGGGGADAMIGFGGSDIYFVDDAGDLVYEAAGAAGGTRDVVFASASYQLIAGQGVEVLSTSALGATTPIALTGNGFAQELYGNAGDNVLSGGGGADTMIGFESSDIYFVDDAADIVYESAGAAGGVRDVVFASTSYQLIGGQAVEVLSTTSFDGTTPINLSGNALGQEIYGNAGANVLNGGGGADSLIGFGGADTFGFTTAPQLGVAAVADFSVAQGDRMVLSSTVYLGLDASATGGQLNAGAFALSTAAAEADDRIVYNAQTGALLFDADGSGAQAAVQFATLLGAPQDLSAASFSVI